MRCQTTEIIKALAGPVAIVRASITAAIITYKFGTIQAGIAASQLANAELQKDIARSQRDIAYDKLKHDLFEKRYEVYTTARELIETISGNTFKTIHDPKLRPMRLKLDEARFFFPPKVTALFSTIDTCVTEYLIGEVERDSAGDDQPARFLAAKKMTEMLKVIVGIYGQFPELMKAELGFSQLTTGAPYEHATKQTD